MGIPPRPNGPGSETDTGALMHTHTYIHTLSEQLFGGAQRETNLNFHTLWVTQAAWLPCVTLYSPWQS